MVTVAEDRLVLSVPEVARMLGRSERWVYEMIQARLIPGRKIGGSVFVPRVKFVNWLNEDVL